ncbi:prephenate dehydratase [Oxalobacter vibrioformis]|uniref:Bifunctional chorismate mutase/prephenate dehydratase n=1 Tax=Oxalobacter vibrioformis TaxID=933080 RepID=A0A9E9LYQ1_9BURK|nr:prephenate dehydratase [Oxalobacter vibrioformis]NLC23143.1 prephenate dehydratase [Oxalobacter sp.]WAW09353.1 prephenate dehydratase [Oxalobacter vibrioformis]
MENELKPLRDQIDAIDVQLLELLNQRARLAQEVGKVKIEKDLPVFRPEREAQVLRGLAERNKGPMATEDVQTIYREVMSACRALERRISVAYLGPSGTYSEQAAYEYFGRAIDIVPCASIDEIFRSAEAGTADYGIVPIENSTEGAITRTLDLLMQTPLTISGEKEIPIDLSLMTLSGTMEGIHTICAHSQALAQCQGWLNQNYPRILRHAVSSNGEAALLASKDTETAAIASDLAGKRYGLEVVNAHIQDDPQNRTRFVVIGHQKTEPSFMDQTSLALSVQNRPGAVYRLLEPLDKHGVSMNRFESRPARSGNWEYYFFVDLIGHAEDERMAAALKELRDRAAYFKVLGSYPMSIE